MILPTEGYTAALVFGGTFAVTYLVVWWRRSKQTQHRYPPCLPSVPILGSMPFLPSFEKLHIHLMEQTKVLGRVFGLNFANFYLVVLNGRDEIQEAFVKRSLDFASRPTLYLSHIFNANRNGIVEHPYNPHFKKFHHLSLTILKKFGFGQGIMERRIQVEVEELNQISKHNGEPLNPSHVVTTSVLNVIVSIIFGKRYDASDPKLKEIISIIHRTVQDISAPMAINIFPFLRFVPKYKQSLKKVYELDDAWVELLEGEIKKSLSGDTEESFISCFVEEEGPEYEHQQLFYTLRDLFLAGTETTATTVQWFLALMANHPEAQSRLQDEIDKVVPRSRLPSLEDKSRLPYVEATTLELMRVKTIVPLGVAHMTMCDTEVSGYFIPANSMVFSNLYSVHMDPEVWEEPEKFRPERFIDETGSIINKDLVIPFSLGKRSCLGEVLARQELFLFMTGLVQQFDIRPPEGQTTVEVHDSVGVTIAPSPYQVRLIKRTVN